MKRTLSLFLIVSSVAGMHASSDWNYVKLGEKGYPDKASKEACQVIRMPRREDGSVWLYKLQYYREFLQKCKEAGYNPEEKL